MKATSYSTAIPFLINSAQDSLDTHKLPSTRWLLESEIVSQVWAHKVVQQGWCSTAFKKLTAQFVISSCWTSEPLATKAFASWYYQQRKWQLFFSELFHMRQNNSHKQVVHSRKVSLWWSTYDMFEALCLIVHLLIFCNCSDIKKGVNKFTPTVLITHPKSITQWKKLLLV